MLAQCATGGFLFGFGDVIAQQLVEGRGRNHDVSNLTVSALLSPHSPLCASSSREPSGLGSMGVSPGLSVVRIYDTLSRLLIPKEPRDDVCSNRDQMVPTSQQVTVQYAH